MNVIVTDLHGACRRNCWCRPVYWSLWDLSTCLAGNSSRQLSPTAEAVAGGKYNPLLVTLRSEDGVAELRRHYARLLKVKAAESGVDIDHDFTPAEAQAAYKRRQRRRQVAYIPGKWTIYNSEKSSSSDTTISDTIGSLQTRFVMFRFTQTLHVESNGVNQDVATVQTVPVVLTWLLLLCHDVFRKFLTRRPLLVFVSNILPRLLLLHVNSLAKQNIKEQRTVGLSVWLIRFSWTQRRTHRHTIDGHNDGHVPNCTKAI